MFNLIIDPLVSLTSLVEVPKKTTFKKVEVKKIYRYSNSEYDATVTVTSEGRNLTTEEVRKMMAR